MLFFKNQETIEYKKECTFSWAKTKCDKTVANNGIDIYVFD